MRIIEKLESFLEIGGTKKDIPCLVLSGIALIISIFHLAPLPFDAAWVAIILCGLPIVLEAIIGLVTAFDIKADVLVSLALIASVIIGEDFAAGEVAFIMQLGALLEDMTVAKARAGIEKLVHLTPQTARIISEDTEKVVPAEEVLVGDIIRVLPGETVPVDGIIISGQTSINQAVMTGESLPVDKGVGDEVSSGTVNQFGAFEMKAAKVGEDSSIQRMIRLVRSADAGKAKIVGIADRWATWIVVIALTAAALTWIFTGEIIRSVTILVVFCPCALVLATPTAIMAAIGNATRHGFLVREGDALERLAKVGKITFDKTGTLTHAAPRVAAVVPFGGKEENDMLALAACLEEHYPHSMAKAVVAEAENRHISHEERHSSVSYIVAHGIASSVDGEKVIIGSHHFVFEDEKCVIPAGEEEKFESLPAEYSHLYLAAGGVLAAVICIEDPLRAEAADVVRGLRSLGFTKLVMMTGDSDRTAKSVAAAVGVDEYYSEVLPEDKANFIRREHEAGRRVIMLGDGVNDSPALSEADAGIAIRDGAAIAREVADITIGANDLYSLLTLRRLSCALMDRIHTNYRNIIGFNFMLICLGVAGILPPATSALLHNAYTLAVSLRSMTRLLPPAEIE